MPTRKQEARLSIVLRAGDRYALAFYARLTGFDLYCGPRLGFGGQDLFRQSYHKSGQSHLRVPIPAGRTIADPGTPLADLKGKKHIGASSSEPQGLEWDYHPKPDSARRRTAILDLETLNAPSFTSELWALEPGRPELVSEAIRWYEERAGVVLAQVMADWCTPHLLLIAWTLRPEAFAALEVSIQS